MANEDATIKALAEVITETFSPNQLVNFKVLLKHDRPKICSWIEDNLDALAFKIMSKTGHGFMINTPEDLIRITEALKKEFGVENEPVAA